MSMESIETLNERLLNLHGKFADTTLPLWRVSYSDEQFEKRLVNGLMLEVKKYPWIKFRYILERAMPIAPTDSFDLGGIKFSFEPVWVFEDRYGNPLPPLWAAIEAILDSVARASARAVGARYKNPEDGNDPLEIKLERVKKMEKALFGNESEVCDALAHKQAVTVPNKQFNGDK